MSPCFSGKEQFKFRKNEERPADAKEIIRSQQISAPSVDLTALIAAINEHIIASLTTVKATDTRAENSKKKSDDTTTA